MRVAICCEMGAPSELVRDGLRIGRALMGRGHVVQFVVGDPIALVDFAGGWTPAELYQAPVIRPAPHLVMKRPPIDGLADVMASMGFDDKQTLLTLATVWDRQLAALKPDVVLAFYAPVPWLVGPGHAPTFALGNGFTLPPPVGTSFPRLRAESTPLADPETLLENANAALGRLGQASLAGLSDIFERCVAIHYGVPAFDPYLQIRRTLTAGLFGEAPAPAVPPVEPRLAAFLDVHCPGIEMIVLALAGFGRTPVDVCVSGATAGMRRFLEQQPHVRVWADQAALLARAASATVLVHHGVQDVAQRCLSLGRPQLVIPWTHEQEVFNEMVRWMSFSWTKAPTVSIDEMAGTFRAALKDNSLVVSAQHHARQLAGADLPDALPGIVERIEKAAAG